MDVSEYKSTALARVVASLKSASDALLQSNVIMLTDLTEKYKTTPKQTAQYNCARVS